MRVKRMMHMRIASRQAGSKCPRQPSKSAGAVRTSGGIFFKKRCSFIDAAPPALRERPVQPHRSSAPGESIPRFWVLCAYTQRGVQPLRSSAPEPKRVPVPAAAAETALRQILLKSADDLLERTRIARRPPVRMLIKCRITGKELRGIIDGNREQCMVDHERNLLCFSHRLP